MSLRATRAERRTTLAPHCVPRHLPPGQVWCSAGESEVEAWARSDIIAQGYTTSDMCCISRR